MLIYKYYCETLEILLKNSLTIQFSKQIILRTIGSPWSQIKQSNCLNFFVCLVMPESDE